MTDFYFVKKKFAVVTSSITALNFRCIDSSIIVHRFFFFLKKKKQKIRTHKKLRCIETH